MSDKHTPAPLHFTITSLKHRAVRAARILLLLVGLPAAAEAAPPIGATIALQAPDDYFISASPRDGTLASGTISTINGHTRYLVESVSSNIIRLKSVGTGLYVRRTGNGNNADIRANGADGNDPLSQWVWIDVGGSDFMLRALNTSSNYFTIAGTTIKMWDNDNRATITQAEPSDGTEEALGWRVIPEDPRFPTDDPILAVCEVTDVGFGLPEDPAERIAEDCTPAFQAAIDYAALAGGGTVFIPEGKYRVDGPLVLKKGIMLQGRWNPPGATNYQDRIGTVIMLENDQLGPNGSFIQGGATIKDLTFWHSKQNPVNGVTPYPWILSSTSGGGDVFVVNITFLNAYRGLYFKNISNSEIKNIYGSAYDIGLDLGPNYAIPRLGNHNMSSEYLGLSGLVTNAEQLTAHDNATYATGTAIQAQRLHTTKYLYGHKIGFRRHKTEDMTKGSQGDLGGVIVRKCQIGMLNDLDDSGGSYINGTLMENCEVAVSFKTGGSFSVNNSAILGSQTWAVVAQTGAINVTINNSMVAPANFSLNGGSVTGSSLTSLPDNLGNATEDPVDEDTGEEVGDGEESLDLSGISYRNPSNPVIFNVKDPQYAGGAKGNGVHDDTAAIQATMTAAATNGGYVFFPGGNYRITSNLVAGNGIQLRGADGGVSSANDPLSGSSISIDMPPLATNEVEAPAAITLGNYSGVRGLAFFYPQQTAGGPVTPFVKFPHTIRGNGVENYVMLCRPINPYRFVHFTGDNSAVSYNQLCGIRQILYSTNNKNGLLDQNLTKVTNWPKSGWPFPGSFDKDSFKGYVMNAGFEILHIKDCDDFVSTFGGSYAHGGFRGATVENSSVTGNLSLEQFLSGWHIVSGNKNLSFRNKTSDTNRDGPAGADTVALGIHLGEAFTGTVVEETGDIHGDSFSDYALVENGTLKRIGGGVSKSMMGIRVAEKGTAIMQDFRFKDSLTIWNEGSIKLFNCTLSDGIYHPYAAQFRADNTIDKGSFIAARLARRTWQSYGLTIDTNGLEYVGSAQAGNAGGFAQSVVQAKTTSGQFNLTVQEPDFINNPPPSMTLSMLEGFVPEGTVLELWYYGTGGWTKHSGSGPSFTLSNTAFGQQQPGENVPDLRLVVTGDSPSLKGFKISADFYQPAATNSPTGLVAANAGTSVILQWDKPLDHSTTYNVYRRDRSSGAFGEPIATGLTDTTFVDSTPGETHDYVITAVGANGLESAISFETDTNWEDQPSVITQSLPEALLYEDYSVNLLARGQFPFAWSVVSGSLPAGMTLSPDGVLSGQPAELGVFDLTVQVRDGNGGEIDTRTLSLLVRYRIPVFSEDFEDDAPRNVTNAGLDIRPDLDDIDEDLADFGLGYSAPVGEYEIRQNPESNGNHSSQALFLNQIGSGTQDEQYLIGFFEQSRPVGNLAISFDFYQSIINGTNLHADDSIRFALIGSDNSSAETEIQLYRSGSVVIDGSTVTGATALTDTWQRFSAVFVATATPGQYDMIWRLSNLENLSSSTGTKRVQLSNGSWSGDSMANGLRLYVLDRKNGEDYQAFFDNIHVTYRPQAEQPEPLEVLTSNLPDFLPESHYLVRLEASGTPPLQWSVVEGSLPSGLALSPDGTLSGIPHTGGISVFTVRVMDGSGASAHRRMRLSSLRKSHFFEDFEDDSPTQTVNLGLYIRPDSDGTGEDLADIGRGYSAPVGQYLIDSNPRPAGNLSAKVVRLASVPGGDGHAHFDGYFHESLPVHQLTVSVDFLSIRLSEAGTHESDALGLHLLGADELSAECEIRLHQNGQFSIDGDAVNTSPEANTWQRFTGFFTSTAMPGVYTLDWSLRNLETNSLATGSTTVDLTDGEWANAGIGSTMACGIRLQTHDHHIANAHASYLDNLTVHSGSRIPPMDHFSEWMLQDPLVGFEQVLAEGNLDGGLMTNLLEFAFGGSVSDGSDDALIGPVVALEANPDHLIKYTYLERKDAAAIGMSYRVEYSETLTADWAAAGITLIERTSYDQEYNLVTVRIPAAAGKQQFVRMSIELK